MNENLIIEFSNKLADEARKIARKYYFQELNSDTVEDKGDQSIVTIADTEIEHELRKLITEKFPEHGILGEEEDAYQLDADYVWVLDPIDGTNSFVLKRPLFGILIGLLYKGKPIMGLIDQPITEERWFAVGKQQTLYNGKPINVSKIETAAKSKVILSNPTAFIEKLDKVWRLKKKTFLLAWEAECYSFGTLSMGGIDAVIKPGLDPYDYLPVVKVIENAGGVICGKNYADLNINYKGDIYACSSKNLLDELMKELN